jgi:hypothetical protein
VKLIIKISRIWTIFQWKKILCIGQNHIFHVEIWQFFPKENKNTDKDPTKVFSFVEFLPPTDKKFGVNFKKSVNSTNVSKICQISETAKLKKKEN